MPKKYQNKYRIKSARLPNWDYGSNGIYFITICTKNREHLFGEIIDGKMVLNAIGKLANQFWNEIPEHFSFVTLGEFVVMPNHTHGVLVLDKMDDGVVDGAVETLQCNVSTAPSTTTKNNQMSKISPKPGSVSTIIRSYKSVVTKNARRINSEFGWQSRFHDHIVRNEKSFHNISNYIINNPSNWEKDRFKSFNI